MFKFIKKQLPQTIKLAIPITLTQMGQMLMGLVDTFMVGKLGPEAIGSVAVANAVFFTISTFAVGLISGLDHFISASLGRGDHIEVRKWKVQGLYYSFCVSLPLYFLTTLIIHNMGSFGVPPHIVDGTIQFSKYFTLSFLPFLVFFSQRQYLQTIGKAKIVTISIILGNIVNIFLNWVLIYGNLGFKPMGLQGSGLSTFLTRIVLAILLIGVAFIKTKNDFKFIPRLHLKLLKLGLPSGLQNLFEVGVFALATTLASRINAQSLAAHSIVLNIASFTFMVPLGISFASAIRVGFFYGEKHFKESIQAGYASIFLGVTTMAGFALLLAAFGQYVVGLFTTDTMVIKIGYHLILLAALFQIADGLQVVATGSLRGLGETRAPAIANLIGHWFVGLPVGAYLCFYTGLGVVGLWCGLTLGLIVVSTTLFIVWRKATQNLLKYQSV